MELISTRGGRAVSPSEAILNGIAKDGGLYVPSSFGTFSKQELSDMAEADYQERAVKVLSKFLTDYSSEELELFTKAAYSKFDGDPAPIIKVEECTYILELFHGPTLAFKDIALTLLPYLITAAKKHVKNDKKTLILVATSGDTGKAALEGFSDVDGTEIVVLYPSDGVSDMQKLQMQTTVGNNVHVIGVNGNFDDTQNAVKKIFNDPIINAEINKMGYELSSANSINFGRLVPQIVYYVSSYLDLVASQSIEEGEEINFVVPSGNFGNILAGYYAKKMGIPIKKLIVASNQNNVLTNFFENGKYNINRDFFKTISPSMDILISSNLERLLYEISDRNADFVNECMQDLKEKGMFQVDIDILLDKIPEYVAYFSDEAETIDAIDNFFDMYGYLVDPHTAVAVSSYYKYLAETNDEFTKTVIISTASPFKFPNDVLYAVADKTEKDAFKATKKLSAYIGEDAPQPILDLENLKVRHKTVVNKEEIEKTILNMLKGGK